MISLDLDMLQAIEKELTNYSDLTRVEMFNKFINIKLAATLANYNEEIDLTSEYLLRQSSMRVLKAMSKIKRINDKDIINQYMETEE